MTRAEQRAARAKAKAEEDERNSRWARTAYAWMMVRTFRLLEDRGVVLSVADVQAAVDYVYEQVVCEIEQVASRFKRSVLLRDVIVLMAIMRLGHAPEKDPTPIPELPPE